MLEGGLLPLISLTCLHFFIKYGEIDNIKSTKQVEEKVLIEEELPVTEVINGGPVEEVKPSAPIEPSVGGAFPKIERRSEMSEKMKKIQGK
jgi:hypothetical protein